MHKNSFWCIFSGCHIFREMDSLLLCLTVDVSMHVIDSPCRNSPKPRWQRLQHPFRWRRHGSPSQLVWFLCFTARGSTGSTDSTGIRNGHVVRGTVPRRHCHCGHCTVDVVHRMQLSGLFVPWRALAFQTDSGDRSIVDHQKGWQWMNTMESPNLTTATQTGNQLAISVLVLHFCSHHTWPCNCSSHSF